jgi:hypothetical protein
MTELPVLTDLDPARLEDFRCCGVKNPEHTGRRLKNCWLEKHFKLGLRTKVLLTPDGRQWGFIEYLPGEHAWRGVNAPGYLFIHCIWTYGRKYQRKGLAGRMLEACVEDARQAGMDGVAVLARDKPWMAGPAIFLANGFTEVAAAPPDYHLMVRKLKPSAADPSLKDGWAGRLKRYSSGLTIIRSDQCPHIAKFADDIAEAAREEFGLEPRIVELKTAKAAQNAPTPYAVFAIIRDGKLLADHQVSRTRFRNIMRAGLPKARPKR